MTDPYISASRRASSLKSKAVADLAKAYQEQVEEWFLKPARRLAAAQSKHDGIAILAILLPLYETHGRMQRGKRATSDSRKKGGSGKGKSREEKDFTKGIKAVFKTEAGGKPDWSAFYSKMRCGITHEGIPKGFFVVPDPRNEEVCFTRSDDGWEVNPWGLLKRTEHFFVEYFGQLQKDSNLRDKFEKAFLITYGATIDAAPAHTVAPLVTAPSGTL